MLWAIQSVGEGGWEMARMSSTQPNELRASVKGRERREWEPQGNGGSGLHSEQQLLVGVTLELVRELSGANPPAWGQMELNVAVTEGKDPRRIPAGRVGAGSEGEDAWWGGGPIWGPFVGPDCVWEPDKREGFHQTRVPLVLD